MNPTAAPARVGRPVPWFEKGLNLTNHAQSPTAAVELSLLLDGAQSPAGVVAATVEEQWDQAASMLTARFPRAAELMATTRENVLACRHFPVSHWRKLWSTNLLERVNEAIKRRTRVVGIFPNDRAVTCLVGRCCWSNMSTGNWRAVACSRSTRWPPFPQVPRPCQKRIRRGLPCRSPAVTQAPAGALVRPSKGEPVRWRPGAASASLGSNTSLRDESIDRSFLTMQVDSMRRLITSGMTARHSTLLAL